VACLLRCKGQSWSYFEIDPLVERVARDERYFTFLRDCPPRVNVVIGDARVTLRSEPDSRYAMILIDAFTSDAIPTHLLTREAIAAYRQKLAPDGLIALHISNRHLTLGPVVGNLARDAGLVGRISKVTPSSENSLVASPAQLVVLAQEPSSLGALSTHPSWLPLPTDTSQRVWTDDHVDIVRTLFR
jgi:spermidine synthase